MKKDRTAIVKILGDMMENPDQSGIFPTSTAYARLEHYVEQQRVEAIGWANADACCALDAHKDPRTMNVPDMLRRALIDLDTKD